MARSPSCSGSVSPPRGRQRVTHSPQNSPRSPTQRKEPDPPADPEQPPKLFITALAPEVTEDDLRTLFQEHGEIVDFFMRENDKGRFAFVTYGSMEEAQKAKEEVNGTELKEKALRVNFAKPRTNNARGGGKTCFKCNKEGHMARECPGAENEGQTTQEADQEPKLYVSNLSQEVYEDDLRTLFQECGEIVDFYLKDADRKIAFITFSSMEEAQKGLQLNGTQLKEQSIRVLFSKPRQKKNAGGGGRACFKCNKEGHMARECPGVEEQEKPQRARSESRSRSPPRRNRSRAASSEGSVQPARRRRAASSNGSVGGGGNMEVEKPEYEPGQQPKLFITSLPDDVTEDEIREVFGKYGEIVDFFMKENDRGKFAFVTYGSMEEAEKGKEGGNGAEIRDNTLRVNLAKPRANRNGGGGGRACFKCNQEGHMARECPGTGMDVEKPQDANQEPKLFVSNLAEEVYEDDLRTLFQECGEIVDFCLKDADRKMAFITFSSMEEAQKGLQLNGTELKQQSIKVLLSKPRQKKNAGGGGRACFKCNKEGHMARDCPGVDDQGGRSNRSASPARRRRSRSSSGGSARPGRKQSPNGMDVEDQAPRKPKTCFKCKKQGHISRDCPEEGDMDVEQPPKLFIANFPDATTETDLRTLFESSGEITDLFIKENDKGRFAFVTFSSMQQAEKGKQCNGVELHGENIRVNFAKPKPKNGQNSRSNVCFKCQQQGHMARECPNQNSYRNGRAGRAQNNDHRRQERHDTALSASMLFGKNFIYNPFERTRSYFPTGKADFINNGSMDVEGDTRANNFRRNGSNGFNGVQEKRNYAQANGRNTRKRSVSRSDSPKRNRSPEDSVSPKARRPDPIVVIEDKPAVTKKPFIEINKEDKESLTRMTPTAGAIKTVNANLKQKGYEPSSKLRNKSRSRSRSPVVTAKKGAAARKRSPSVDSY